MYYVNRLVYNVSYKKMMCNASISITTSLCGLFVCFLRVIFFCLSNYKLRKYIKYRFNITKCLFIWIKNIN